MCDRTDRYHLAGQCGVGDRPEVFLEGVEAGRAIVVANDAGLYSWGGMDGLGLAWSGTGRGASARCMSRANRSGFGEGGSGGSAWGIGQE